MSKVLAQTESYRLIKLDQLLQVKNIDCYTIADELDDLWWQIILFLFLFLFLCNIEYAWDI